MDTLSSLISYYRDCYQADTRTLSLTNFFSQKIENRLIISGEDEILNGHLPYYPITEEYFREVQKNLTLYTKEKTLYCCAFFIIGTHEIFQNKNSTVCGPLFLYPTELVEENELQYVRIHHHRRIVNINLLNSLKKKSDVDLFSLLNKEVPPSLFDFGDCGKIKDILEDHLNEVDGGDLLLYPNFYTEAKIKKLVQPKQISGRGKFIIIPSMAFGVMKKSNQTLGVLSDLAEMATKPDHSQPVRYMLSERTPGNRVSRLRGGYVPVVLNQAQKDILRSANESACTVVVGPPGTGKSFTIAALAIEFMSKGKSVLIASKTDQAVDVIAHKIEKDLGFKGVVIRAGRSNYRKELKAHLKNLLSGIRRRPDKPKDLTDVKRDLKRNDRELKSLQKAFESQVRDELKWGKYLAENFEKHGFLVRLGRKYIKWRNGLRQPHWKTMSSLFVVQTRHLELIKSYVERHYEAQVRKIVSKKRKMFVNFSKALSARNSSRQEYLFKGVNFATLLEAFPVWLTNMSDIHETLPLRSGMFDLAIIDEATQCDIASSLPIFERARRIVVVGDPKQLRHVSFLSDSVQKTLQRKHKLKKELLNGCDYRNLSILDLVLDRMSHQDNVIFLNEHFRSCPEIIRFSNEHFYDNAMRVMTSRPGNDMPRSIFQVKAGGQRRNSGINVEEAEMILDKVKQITRQQSNLDKKMCHTIGILSPFRDQTDYIAAQLPNVIDLATILKHQITCGTAYSFQGEERDVMLLSMVIDNSTHATAVAHLNKPDVFNVSITRARSEQYIYTSFDDLSGAGEYLGLYLSTLGKNMAESEVNERKDAFVDDLKQRLTCDGMETWKNFEMSGLVIDLVFKRNNQFIGVDFIGYPGAFEEALTVNEFNILNRAGLKTFSLPFTYWSFDKERCYQELMKFSESD